MKNAMPRNPKAFKLISVLLGIGLALGLLLFVEFISSYILKSKGLNPYPFFINATAKQNPDMPIFARRAYTFYDPLLGYAHNPAMIRDEWFAPGFVLHGKKEVEQGKTVRIVALGGSTTDGNNAFNLSWSKVLLRLMEERGIEAQILNGGVAGYTSSQELLKLIRDVLPLEPDIIVSLDGVNDLGYVHAIPEHPMVHEYQQYVMEYLANGPEPYFLPNTIHLLNLSFKRVKLFDDNRRGINYGTTVNITSAKEWERNVRMMHAVSEEYGIPFLVFLQPTLGVGKYNISKEEEEKMLTNDEGKKISGYLKLVRDFYQEARESCKGMPYCIDLVDVFHTQQNLYYDKRHPTIKGYEILSSAIYAELAKRYKGILAK